MAVGYPFVLRPRRNMKVIERRCLSYRDWEINDILSKSVVDSNVHYLVDWCPNMS